MHRPDLMNLSDEQLIAAANRGLLKRAQQEVAVHRAATHVESDGGLVVDWSDDIRCEFPPASSVRGARCSCAAATVCRHILRSVLYLRRLPPSQVEGAGEERAPDPIELGENELAGIFGKAGLTKARRQLGKELSMETASGNPREVHFGKIGIVTQFPVGAAIAGAICSCHEPFPCPHLLPALLWLRGERSVAPQETSETVALARGAAIQRLRRLLTELMRAGLDGVSPGWQEGALGLRLELEKAGLTKPARLLEALSRLVAADIQRTGDADPGLIRWNLAALWLRLLASASAETEQGNDTQPDDQVPDDLLVHPVHRFWSSGSKTLLGLTCSAWWTEDLVGVTMYMREEETGEVVTVGTARPRDRGSTVARLTSNVPIFGELTARDLLGRRLECSSTRRAEGKLRLGANASCRLLPEPIDWESLIAREAITTIAEIGAQFEKAFPTIATLGRSDVFLFRPVEFLEAEFRIDLQELDWPIVDGAGRKASLVLRYRPERQSVIADLQTLAAKEIVVAVLGRAYFSPRGLALQPMTLFLKREHGLRAHCVDIDRYQTEEIDSRNRKHHHGV